jgi:Cu-Zn family superoxide dismutase
MRPLLPAALLLALSAVASAAPPADAEPLKASAILRDGAGTQVGTATLVQDDRGVRIAIGVKGLPPGRHGFHFHAVGRCDGPDFTSAGGHFNPGKKPHGPPGSPASHAGDLPDLVASADGSAAVGFIAPGVTLGPGPASLLGGAGTALVLTAGPEEGHDAPGGKRLSCGVVTRR